MAQNICLCIPQTDCWFNLWPVWGPPNIHTNAFYPASRSPPKMHSHFSHFEHVCLSVLNWAQKLTWCLSNAILVGPGAVFMPTVLPDVHLRMKITIFYHFLMWLSCLQGYDWHFPDLEIIRIRIDFKMVFIFRHVHPPLWSKLSPRASRAVSTLPPLLIFVKLSQASKSHVAAECHVVRTPLQRTFICFASVLLHMSW